MTGPSPRVWGKLLSGGEVFPNLRTIPTRVGKTFCCDGRRFSASDHPHACGENSTNLSRSRRSFGPSPRVWGKLIVAKNVVHNARTIPTRVGKTGCLQTGNRYSTDHPHACGENGTAEPVYPYSGGPSPRVWGKQKFAMAVSGMSRTIPTRVGKTFRKKNAIAAWPDHPHACGENPLPRRQKWEEGGPSPRVWGKPIRTWSRRGMSRTIPTRVGKTSSHLSVLMRFTDHPHACGENTKL